MKAFSEQQRQSFLADVRVGVLSVATTDGRPPASAPIWYGYTPGGDILVSTGAGSRKARLIEQAGGFTLTVQREELPYQYVTVECTVVDTTRPVPDDVQLAIAVRYLGEEGGRAFVEQMAGTDNVLYTVRPDRWITADFSDEV
jgi:uncharacterized protein